MAFNQNHNSIEEEINKRLDQIDKRFDRNGWFFIVVLVLTLFVAIYLFMNFFSVDNDQYVTNSELTERIEQLEVKLQALEEQVQSLSVE